MSDDDAAAQFARLPSWLLTQAAARAHRLVADGLAAVDARGHTYRILSVLHESGPASQADLGRRSAIHLSDVVAVINDLQSRNLVERTPDPVDRRRNVIVITRAGRRTRSRLDRQMKRIQDQLLAPLSHW